LHPETEKCRVSNNNNNNNNNNNKRFDIWKGKKFEADKEGNIIIT
jgi:hypothetical protein